MVVAPLKILKGILSL